jgi:excisionase family DNA binding protein
MALDADDDSRILQASDALSPEGLADELASKGITIPADVIRQRALQLGACRLLGDAMFLLPEDVNAILRAGKQLPASMLEKSKAKVEKRISDPAQGQARNVYTPPMLAKRWGCSERHVRNMIDQGKLGCFRLGKLIRIMHSDVEAAEKAFTENAFMQEDPSTPQKGPANQIMTRAPVNAIRAKRLDR